VLLILKRFCFSCGKIDHTRKECEEVVCANKGGDKVAKFGPWMLVDPSFKDAIFFAFSKFRI